MALPSQVTALQLPVLAKFPFCPQVYVTEPVKPAEQPKTKVLPMDWPGAAMPVPEAAESALVGSGPRLAGAVVALPSQVTALQLSVVAKFPSCPQVYVTVAVKPAEHP